MCVFDLHLACCYASKYAVHRYNLAFLFCSAPVSSYPTGWPKNLAHFVLYSLTLSDFDRFSNLFHCQNQENICNNTVIKDPTSTV